MIPIQNLALVRRSGERAPEETVRLAMQVKSDGIGGNGATAPAREASTCETESAAADSVELERARTELAEVRRDLAAMRRDRDMLRGVFECFARFGESLGDSRDAFRDLSMALSAQRDSAAESASLSEHHREEFQRTAAVLRSLFSGIGDAARQVGNLARSAEQIDHSVRSIQGVADQTRLLAINAQIEAARAGDAGRGFAVVAEEVGRLSDRARKATLEIADLLMHIRGESKGARDIIERAGEVALECSEQSERSMRSARALVDRQQSIESGAAVCALLSNVEFANVEELMLKLEVYKVTFDVSALRAEDFPDETSCQLGHWYYDGDGRANFSKLAGYAELEVPHRAVHVHARAAVAEHHANRGAASLEALRSMEDANHAVIRGLRDILAKQTASMLRAEPAGAGRRV